MKKITLYEYLKMTEADYDTYDNVYDAEVTVCYNEDEDDNYVVFCNELVKKVDIIERNNNYTLTVNWSDLIKRNMQKFKEFAKKHWYEQYEDDEDEFIYQWITELNSYIAGYVPEDFYENLVEFVNELI